MCNSFQRQIAVVFNGIPDISLRCELAPWQDVNSVERTSGENQLLYPWGKSRRHAHGPSVKEVPQESASDLAWRWKWQPLQIRASNKLWRPFTLDRSRLSGRTSDKCYVFSQKHPRIILLPPWHSQTIHYKGLSMNIALFDQGTSLVMIPNTRRLIVWDLFPLLNVPCGDLSVSSDCCAVQAEINLEECPQDC